MEKFVARRYSEGKRIRKSRGRKKKVFAKDRYPSRKHPTGPEHAQHRKEHPERRRPENNTPSDVDNGHDDNSSGPA